MKEYLTRERLLKATGYIWLGVGVVALIAVIASKLIGWGQSHRLIWKFPVEITTHSILEVVEIEPKVITRYPTSDIDFDNMTKVEAAIFEAFGIENYKLMRAVAVAESGLEQNTWNTNAIGSKASLDLGLFQINSTHYDKPECSFDKVVTLQGNIVCAKHLFETQGVGIWTTVQNGSVGIAY